MLYFQSMKKSDAIRCLGSASNLARACGVTRAAVHQWPEELKEPRASHVREVLRQLGLMRRNKIVARVSFE